MSTILMFIVWGDEFCGIWLEYSLFLEEANSFWTFVEIVLFFLKKRNSSSLKTEKEKF